MLKVRLRELRREKHLYQKDIANYLNISTSAYGYYEQGKRNPDSETIKKLADFYNVSTDYILGRTDIKEEYTGLSNDSNEEITPFKNYKTVEQKIRKRLINEKILLDDESITQDMLDKFFKYGMEATIEILKLKKKLDE